MQNYKNFKAHFKNVSANAIYIIMIVQQYYGMKIPKTERKNSKENRR